MYSVTSQTPVRTPSEPGKTANKTYGEIFVNQISPSESGRRMDYFTDGAYMNAASKTSKHTQSTLTLVLLVIGALVVITCLTMIAWLAFHGPAIVPGQDTRITAVLISSGSRLAWLFICVALFRSAWGSLLPHLLSGESIPVSSLISACRGFMSLGQMMDFHSLPVSFRLHILIGVFISVAMTATSASFRYESLGVTGESTALVADTASACDASRVNFTSYFCDGNLNANTTGNSCTYLEEVIAGGQGTVERHGRIGIDQTLSANVTVALLPQGWILRNESNLPWMAIAVTCKPLNISAIFSGQGALTNAAIYVNERLIDNLDIANMPAWNSVVHLYQQVNQTGPASSICPWIVVMIARDLDDGGANIGGLSGNAVTYLGNSYLDLHGYGPIVQGVIGAATLCEFEGSTGGTWPDGLWPPHNSSNTILGELIDDRPTLATAMLNYGPSWQYSPISDNSLPGGSVTYIANNTGPGVDTFAALFASYIRNQWTLMAYSIPRQSGKQLSVPFSGTGPEKLFVRLTAISALPATALVVGLVIILRAFILTIIRRYWINRVEFESWWLVKALCPQMYRDGFSNATEDDFLWASKGFLTAYKDTRPESDVGHLQLVGPNQVGTTVPINRRRIYG